MSHHRDEEKEHAAMLIEWLRRHDSVFDTHPRIYLFTTHPIVGIEASAAGGGGAAGGDGSLGIGSLKRV